MALSLDPANVVSRKRKRDWENDIDDSRGGLGFESSTLVRLCDLDVQEELEAEAFEEELISDVMKSLEQEIQTSSASSSDISNGSITSVCGEGGVDMEYLLEATDKDLGLPPSPTQQEFDSLFANGMEDVLEFGLYAEAESVELLNEGEDWMSRNMSAGLFQAPYL